MANSLTIGTAQHTMRGTLSEKFDFVQAQIRRRDLSIHPQSRLAQEAAVFLDERGCCLRKVPHDDPNLDRALEALRDYTLFEYILESWPFGERDQAANARLRLSLKDAVDPYAPARVTAGRDTQLELFVAVALHRAGLQVDLTSPDVRTRLDNRYFYVEAKHPKTQDGVDNAVRDAARQIANSGCPGAVFLDISMAFNPTRGRVTRIMSDAEFARLHPEALRRGIDLVAHDVAKAVKGKPVAAICFQDHQLRQYAGGWKLESCCMTYTNPDASARLAALARLFERTLDRSWPK